MKHFIILFGLFISGFSMEIVKTETFYLNEASAYFYNQKYTKAYEAYKVIIDNFDSPEAAYQLGWMYENGKGVTQDSIIAISWYKKAAKFDLAKNKEKVYEATYRNLDPLDDKESTNTLVQIAQGKFGLRAYYPNYGIVSYTDKIPKGEKRYEEDTSTQSTLQTADDTKYIHTETKYQISFRADYITEWLGFTQMWSGAYTQTSYWQIFINSAPFRDTNYKPELFVTIPFFHKADIIGLKGIAFGYKHSSNGQAVSDGNRTRPTGPVEGSRSRSWNRLYTRAYFQWDTFFTELTVWQRIKEPLITDDNPDIMDYYGHGSLEIGYIHKKLLTRLTLKPSFTQGHLTGEVEMSYPVPISDNVFFFLQAFSGLDFHGNYGGYGQSLIDYDQKVNQIGFGLSISR